MNTYNAHFPVPDLAIPIKRGSIVYWLGAGYVMGMLHFRFGSSADTYAAGRKETRDFELIDQWIAPSPVALIIKAVAAMRAEQPPARTEVIGHKSGALNWETVLYQGHEITVMPFDIGWRAYFEGYGQKYQFFGVRYGETVRGAIDVINEHERKNGNV